MSDVLIPSAAEIQAAITQRYVAAAGLVIVLYEILISLGKEVKLIWKAPMSLAKCLFIFNRYTVPVALIFNQYMMAGLGGTKSNDFCAHYLLGLEVVQIVEAGGIIPLMLLLRVHALYGRSRYILWPLAAVIGASVITCLVLEAIAMVNMDGFIVFLPVANMCITLGKPTWIWSVWFFMAVYELVFECIIFVLIILKTWQHSRLNMRTPLLTILARDGVLYFGIMFLLLLALLASYIALPDTMYLVVVYLTWSLHSTLISRIYLNLKGVYNGDQWGMSVALRDDVTVEEYPQGIVIATGRQRRLSGFTEIENFELVGRVL